MDLFKGKKTKQRQDQEFQSAMNDAEQALQGDALQEDVKREKRQHHQNQKKQ